MDKRGVARRRPAGQHPLVCAAGRIPDAPHRGRSASLNHLPRCQEHSGRSDQCLHVSCSQEWPGGSTRKPPRNHIDTWALLSARGSRYITRTHHGMRSGIGKAPPGGVQSQPGRAEPGCCHPPGDGTRSSSGKGSTIGSPLLPIIHPGLPLRSPESLHLSRLLRILRMQQEAIRALRCWDFR